MYKDLSVQLVHNTYCIRRISILNLEEVHRPDHGLHRHENILIHKFDESSLILVRVAGAMDDPHLLNKGGLARFTGPCDKVSVIRLAFDHRVKQNRFK